MKISKFFELKVNKIVEYFAFLKTKFVNTKNIGICISNHPLQATHLTPFVFLIIQIDCHGDYFDIALFVCWKTWTMCV